MGGCEGNDSNLDSGVNEKVDGGQSRRERTSIDCMEQDPGSRALAVLCPDILRMFCAALYALRTVSALLLFCRACNLMSGFLQSDPLLSLCFDKTDSGCDPFALLFPVHNQISASVRIFKVQ